MGQVTLLMLDLAVVSLTLENTPDPIKRKSIYMPLTSNYGYTFANDSEQVGREPIKEYIKSSSSVELHLGC